MHLYCPATFAEDDEIDVPGLVHADQAMRVVFAAGCLQAVGQKSVTGRIRVDDQIVIRIVVRGKVATPGDLPALWNY